MYCLASDKQKSIVDPDMEHHHKGGNTKEYVKFFFVLLFISVLSYVWTMQKNFTIYEFMESFMGVFFVVFASFKLINLKEFAYGFQSYDILAKKSLAYSYSYPFIQMALGITYLINLGGFIWVNLFVLVLSLVSSAGVIKSLVSKQDVHCVCLGNVVKLPLSTISFVEDFGMALMALAMIVL